MPAIALIRRLVLLCLPVLLSAQDAARSEHYDVVVYGGTSAGVMAAVQAKRLGKTVVLAEPGRHLGGMTASGLGATDIGRKEAIGGLSRAFYRMMHEHYQGASAWQFETRAEFLPKHEDAVAEDLKMHFFFEPAVAESLFLALVRQQGIPVRFRERLDRAHGVVKRNGRIESIGMESGLVLHGKVFLDTTYEGDLMAAAGVSYTVGREPNRQYDETLAGIRYLDAARTAHVSPYVVAGDPASGPLPGIDPAPPGPEGDGDRRVQAYNFRVTLTDLAENRVEIARPDGYEPALYELLARHLQAKPAQRIGMGLFKLTPMPNRKTDSNNQGSFSTDFVGFSHEWTEASHAERERLWQRHRDYVQGLFWFLSHDERVPAPVRTEARRWGLPKDEFTDNGHWPWQLYVREARRMVADYVVTEHDCLGARVAEDPVGLAAYEMDSHQVSRFIDANGQLRLEGAFWKPVPPYPISYRAMVPRETECANLLVPVCLSASHAAYGSIRMEPVFMILGQSAATAASQAIDEGQPVQRISYPKLAEQLRRDGQVLSFKPAPAAGPTPAVARPTEPQPAKAPAPSAALRVALEKLARAGAIEAPDYWQDHAREGRTVEAARVAALLCQVAARIDGGRVPADALAALTLLKTRGVIDNDTYWRDRLPSGRACNGSYVAALLHKLAQRL